MGGEGGISQKRGCRVLIKKAGRTRGVKLKLMNTIGGPCSSLVRKILRGGKVATLRYGGCKKNLMGRGKRGGGNLNKPGKKYKNSQTHGKKKQWGNTTQKQNKNKKKKKGNRTNHEENKKLKSNNQKNIKKKKTKKKHTARKV